MRGKYLTPDAPASGFVCRTLRIPNGEEFLAAVNGALLELCNHWNWEQFGALSPVDTAALFFTMYEDYRESRGCVLGTIFAHANANAPAGSLACDGASHLKSDYPDLYAALDSVFIVDADTFRVPDICGRSVIGAGQGTGLTNRALDAALGAEGHVLATAEIPAHAHSINSSIVLYTVGPAPAAVLGGFPPITATNNAGGGGSHNNMQPSRALHYAIWAR